MSDLLSQADESAESLELLAKDRELTRLKGQLRSLNQRYRAAVEELDAWEQRAELLALLQDAAPPKAVKKSSRKTEGRTSAILVLTDWHVEEQVDPSTCNGLNEYNLDIAGRRIERCFQKAVQLIDAWGRTWPVDDVVVALLGDFITGYIHPELEESNYLSPTEAVLFAQEKIRAGIDYLLGEMSSRNLILPCCYGNHGRTTLKMRQSTGHLNSYEWLMYRYLQDAYKKEPRVRFQIANGYHNWLTLHGHDVRLHHGDGIRFGGGVGGITIPTNKRIAAWNKSRAAAFDVFGHWHQFMEAWNFVSCGCAIGYGPFALRNGFGYEPPTQTLIFVSESHGKAAALPIYLEG